MEKKKAELRCIKVTYYCPWENMEITQEISELDITAGMESCDTCGEHGEVTVDILCICKRMHELCIKTI